MIKIEKIINKSKTERFRTSYVPFQGIPKKEGKKEKETIIITIGKLIKYNSAERNK